MRFRSQAAFILIEESRNIKGLTKIVMTPMKEVCTDSLEKGYNGGREQGGGGDKSWPVHKKRECWQIWALECPVFVTSEDSTTLSFMVDRMAASKDIVK